MDAFYQRLIVGAATIDEALSDAFEAAPGQKADMDLAARRLADWCRAATGGDRSLFDRRLARDGLAATQVLARFADPHRLASAPAPGWGDDAVWIERALQTPQVGPEAAADLGELYAFEQLFLAPAAAAEIRLWADIPARAKDNLSLSAHTGLRRALLKDLSELCAPALYERFAQVRKAKAPHGSGNGIYLQFVAEMQTGGWRSLFAGKPVLLRLIATLTRQWIDSTAEFILRLDADRSALTREFLSENAGLAARIETGVSDPHNNGRTVSVVSFTDGSRVVYKPKDLRLDVAWHALIERLNHAGAPIELRAVRTLVREGYGWSEFIEHAGTNAEGSARFFRRAGAWLALFHCFAAADMHQENMIASGEHPVPIDLETIFHTAPDRGLPSPEEQAADAARNILASSVMAVGLLPAYGRSPFNNVFAIGGLTADWTSRTVIEWANVNTDEMRPTKARQPGTGSPNLPQVDGVAARFSDHIEDFISGFSGYAKFLSRINSEGTFGNLFDGFAGLPVRRVIRPTRFYAMLLQRLKNHLSMGNGITWSAQADFIARLANWEKDDDTMWPLQRAERRALLALNVPHFVSPSDGSEIADASGIIISPNTVSGLERAKARLRNLDDGEIAWQVEVIRENTNSRTPAARHALPDTSGAPTREIFIAEADKAAAKISSHAIRRGPGAAWIGLDWLGDSDMAQLTNLGPDLYNGTSGIALFLAAHAVVTGTERSADLALAGIAYLRRQIKSRNAARFARSLGLGGGTGLGGIVYALTAMAAILRDDALRADALAASDLVTDELIAADKQLDVIGGAAGAVLGLLRLYRDSGSEPVLRRANKCGEHLLAQSRLGAQGRRSWIGQGLGTRALNGMSHGAAGFAYALAALAAASSRDDFAAAASECIAFENSSYDAARKNWPDLRGSGEPSWPCQWCHGALGIGLARIATGKRGAIAAKLMATDVEGAVAAVERAWPNTVDTLCCGTLGSVEFLCEAAGALDRGDLRELAARRLASVLQAASSSGDYRWNSGGRQFNLGLFRGLAGVGYTTLRQADRTLPNVLIWD